MILQALHSCYSRLFEQNKVPEFGFGLENVGFALEIDSEGNLIQEHDLRQGEGKDVRPILMEIPFTNEVNVRASNVQPNFLVDKAIYLLGNDEKTKKDRLKLCHKQFKNLLLQVTEGISDDGLAAVRSFYDKWEPEKAPTVLKYWQDIAGGSSGFIVFRLSGERDYIHNHKDVREAWMKFLVSHGTGVHGDCLLTGENKEIQRVHAQFKGIKGGQATGKSLVSFNFKSVESYRKEQSYNAPISIQAEFNSSTALKYLIRSDAHHVYIGEAFTVFWTERDSPVEDFFGMILDPGDSCADDQELAVYLESVRQGKFPQNYDPDIRFYILGLSPNAARLSVRFWHTSTVKDISDKLGQHFRDLLMVRAFDSEPQYPGMWHLLRETTNRKSSEGPPPLLAGAVMQSILKGTPYPQALLSAVIGRIRAEQSARDNNGRPIQNVSYMRAAIIKAVLVRKKRILNQGMEVAVSLDKENTNVAYLLGRLFAVLEKAQQDAIPGANATIKDRFYGSASATPRIVFPQLLRLAQHHIEKGEHGRTRDRQIEEIVCHIKEFPAHMALDQQGMFAIGYYHQRQDFFAKKGSSQIEGAKQ